MTTAQPAPAPAPRAKRQPQRRSEHGVELIDEYAWLRDANWREAMRDPAQLAAPIRAYLDAENAHAESVLAPTQRLQKTLVAEMRGRILEDDASVPDTDGPWAYYTRFREGGEYPVFCRRPRGHDDEEQILLDGDAEAADCDYFRIGTAAHSNDHAKLAFTIDASGAEVFTLQVRDLASGQAVQPSVGELAGGVVWSADSNWLFYTTLDDNHRPCRVWRLALGGAPETAELVYEEADPGFFVGLGETQSGVFIVIDAHDHQTSEVRLIDAHAPETAPRLIAERDPGVEYDVDHDGDHLTILTNADGAEDFKLVRAPIDAPGRANWSDLVPHQPGRLILEHVELARFRARMERVDALPRIVITAKADGAEHSIGFDEDAYALGMDAGLEFDTDNLRFVYTSPSRPAETWDYDMASRERRLRKRRQIPSGHDPEDYVVRRLAAPTADGETVPVTVLHHRDTPIDGSAPCVLYGYGAYGITDAASFAGNRLSLVDRGFVAATAHVRGGMDKGYAWYKNGKLLHKTNTFDDFAAAAEHLIAQHYTRAGKIAAVGGSAGGMLVGAVLNRRPDLLGAAIADVPFVDVLNTMLDPELPLTPPEWPEWGNPIEDPQAFANIRSYCPYQNVCAQAYPPILAIAGVSDPRVTYWEPAKWVARLRATKTDHNPLLLKTHMAAGHGGRPGRFEALEETALIYAFLLDTLAPGATATGQHGSGQPE